MHCDQAVFLQNVTNHVERAREVQQDKMLDGRFSHSLSVAEGPSLTSSLELWDFVIGGVKQASLQRPQQIKQPKVDTILDLCVFTSNHWKPYSGSRHHKLTFPKHCTKS